MSKDAPINPRVPTLWHGGDYNPDQWPEEVRRDDVRLMNLAHVNVATTAVFAWSQLEPQPGRYDWSWLDETFDRLHKGGVYIALATPSAAHPRWLTAMHPEVMAVDSNGRRLLHGYRQRFCPSSPVFREHVARLNRALAERYRGHPALVLWHVSNEYGPSCWCDLCAENFRRWLKDRYGSLDTLNAQYWSSFWSQRFGQWSEVLPPSDLCSWVPNGLMLDWKRFQSHMVCDFFKHEVAILKQVAPQVPVTTNLMGFFHGLDYAKFADGMDVISWDSYPQMGADPAATACNHAMMRGLKANRPWLLIEQTPSSVNWMEYYTLKPPGRMRLWSWQAIGHGSDSAMYFQWRRSRGGPEKFHGAVVAHVGNEKPRVFQEVAALGAEMEKIGPRVVGTAATAARVGILWDQENRWALEGSSGPSHNKRLLETVFKHFGVLWRNHISADMVRMDADWSHYKVLIAPMMYLIKSGQYPLQAPPEEMRGRLDEAEKIEKWVAAGGTFVTTYLTGIVNESDLVYEGGYPGPLRRLLGIWAEELDMTPPGKAANALIVDKGAFAGAKARYRCDRVFDLIHAETARVIARYGANWYKGRPCLTVNKFGQGLAYYIATDAEDKFLAYFYRALAAAQGIQPLVKPTAGLEVLEREGAGRRLIFFLNHGAKLIQVNLGKIRGKDLLSGKTARGTVKLEPCGIRIIECA
jgi:beta-galactosidase